MGSIRMWEHVVAPPRGRQPGASRSRPPRRRPAAPHARAAGLQHYLPPSPDLVILDYAVNNNAGPGPKHWAHNHPRSFERLLRRLAALPSRPLVLGYQLHSFHPNHVRCVALRWATTCWFASPAVPRMPPPQAPLPLATPPGTPSPPSPPAVQWHLAPDWRGCYGRPVPILSSALHQPAQVPCAACSGCLAWLWTWPAPEPAATAAAAGAAAACGAASLLPPQAPALPLARRAHAAWSSSPWRQGSPASGPPSGSM